MGGPEVNLKEKNPLHLDILIEQKERLLTGRGGVKPQSRVELSKWPG